MRTETIMTTLGATVGQGGSFNIAYPDGKDADDYQAGANPNHVITSISGMPIYARKGEFSVAFGASNIVVTLLKNLSYQNGAKLWLHIDAAASTTGDGSLALASPAQMDEMHPVIINLGTPIATDSDSAVASQAATAADGLATGINGVLASGGVATFDVPRNVVAAWTGTAVLTVTGTDQYGNVVVESSASGTSLAGKKAFKTITGIAVSANVTGLTVGHGNVLGLPVYLASVSHVVREILNDATATAGTLVAGDTATATATTGDVRGTVVPNSAPNGTNVYELIAMLRAPDGRGVAQFAG